MFSTLLALFAAASSVAAHGYVSSVNIDGTNYQGSEPNTGNTDTAIRLIDSIDPVKGADNSNLKCGQDAVRVDKVADANPGSNLDIAWSNGQWPHNTGPVITYMADCGDSCTQFDSSNAKWFKIDEKGRKDNGDWYQQDLMDGKSLSVQIPDNLKSGNYLLRHEIIALHLAETQGGAEFYPSCTQLKVGGNGNGVPSDDETVSFPGAYSDTDPGILVPNVYDAKANYQMPGPKIASLAAGSGSGGNDNGDDNNDDGDDNNSSDSPSSTSSAGNSQPSGTNSHISTGSCKLKSKKNNQSKRSVAATNDTITLRAASGAEYKPRHVSRVMRDLVFPLKH